MNKNTKNQKQGLSLGLFYNIVVKNKDGIMLYDSGEKESKSFVIQFLEFIYFLSSVVGAGNRNATATDGTEQPIYLGATTCQTLFYSTAGAGEDRYGIVIGTGDTAVTNVDFKLETQLTHGVGLGDITHGLSTVGITAIVGDNVDLVLTRTFTNSTGSTITVKEAGLYITYSAIKFHCIIRDVLAETIDVPDTCSITVNYTLRTMA